MFVPAAASPLESASARFSAVAAGVLALALLLMPSTGSLVLLGAQVGLFAVAAAVGFGSRCAWATGALVTGSALAALSVGAVALGFALVAFAVISSVLHAAFGVCLAVELVDRVGERLGHRASGARR